MRRIQCSLWHCTLSKPFSSFLARAGLGVGCVHANSAASRAPALPARGAASGHPLAQPPALQGHPRGMESSSPPSWGCKKPISTSRYKMGNKWCKSAGSTKYTRANICVMQIYITENVLSEESRLYSYRVLQVKPLEKLSIPNLEFA